ncbi:MAG: nuclease [Thermoleophilia bacterium]|nr:nuclease [Thermoleophilia bacterium]
MHVTRTATTVEPQAALRVAQFNAENLFDDVDDRARRDDAVEPERYAVRLAKLALTVRDTLRGADLVALEEIENQHVLDDLLAQPALAGLGYRSVLVEGNDMRGIDTALLYRADRLHLDHAETLTPDAPHDMRIAGGSVDAAKLFARPPLIASFTLQGPLGAAEGARSITIVANHFKSKVGENPRVAVRRDVQAATVGAWVDAWRAARPGADVLVVGDLNANPRDRAMELLTRDARGQDRLLDAPTLLPKPERYTGSFQGEPTLLDHLLATPELHARLTHVELPHLNSGGFGDPDDPATPDGSSDHDPIVATYRLG